MTSHSRPRFVINTGTASLALLLAVSAPSAMAAPSTSASPSASTSASPNASASETAQPSPTPTSAATTTVTSSTTASEAPTPSPAAVPSSPTPTSTLEKASKAPASSATAASPSSSTTPASPSATPTASSTPQQNKTSAPVVPGNSPTPSPTAVSPVQLVAATAARPGQTYQGEISGIPEKQHIAVSLISPNGAKEDALPCTVDGQTPSATFKCEIPQNQKNGKYALHIAFLDEQNKPVQNNGQPVIDTSHTVYIADVDKDYNPQILAQYPVTAAGYVMPIAGGGYEPNSTVTISALNETGQKIPGVTFTHWVDNGTPSTDDLSGAQDTLTVQTDATGAFKAYVITSPYMSSASVKITAEDAKNKISVADTLGILGESAAELSTSVDSIVAGDNQTVSISGTKFAPSYANYPVTLQLVQNGKVITDEPIELSGPSGDNLWSSFDAVALTDTASLEAGSYTLQAVVPNDSNVPAEYRGRLLAQKAFTVTAPVLTPPTTSTPTDPVTPQPSPVETTSAPVPEPTSSPVSDQPVPTASAQPTAGTPAETSEPAQPSPTASASAARPAETAEPVPENRSEPAVLERSNTPVVKTVPLIKQEKKPEATESALDQNPTWIQASSIKAEDPRVQKEPNQQLKSSVLNAQGSKNAEGRFDPTNGSSLPGATDAANNASAVVNLNKSVPWWPILLLLVVALIIGTLTGMFISRTAKNQDGES